MLTITTQRFSEGAACTELDRSFAESDDDHKQVLTYILVTRGGDEVLCYQRGSYNRTEDMLRGLGGCVGFGGHVNAEDRDLFADDDAGILRAAARELNEELKLPTADKLRLAANKGIRVIGLLNDDSSPPVGRRHFAVLLEYKVSDDSYWDSPQRGEKVDQSAAMAKTRRECRPRPIRVLVTAGAPSIRPLIWSLRAQRFMWSAKKPFLQPPHIMCVVGPIGSGKNGSCPAPSRELWIRRNQQWQGTRKKTDGSSPLCPKLTG